MGQLPITIEEAAAGLRIGQYSAVELTTAALERTEANNDVLGAFICLTKEEALAAAAAADKELKAGIDRGPLHGLPLAIKDIITTADAPTTANSNVLDRAWGHQGDAPVTANLREAGAALTGKLVLSEFAIGWPDPATGFPVPRNPWNLAHSPGGSSSGTGVAVAANLVLGGLGTDTGGSIRGPAAYCGISGIKPTFGRVSKRGCVPLGYTLDHIGPMSRSVYGCAAMLQVLAGYDPLDPRSVDAPVPDYLAALDGKLDGLRIGVPHPYFFSVPQLDAEVKTAVLAAIAAMEEAGAIVKEVSIAHAAEGRYAQWVTMLSEAYTYHEPDLQTRPEVYGKWTRDTIRRGALFSAADYVQAQRVRTLVTAEAKEALAEVDVLVVPAMITPAPAYAGYNPDAMLLNPSFTGIWNLTGFPAMSIPCGFSAGGLPLGMQIVALPFAEELVFKAGDAYQRITDWHLRVPTIAKEAIPA